MNVRESLGRDHAAIDRRLSDLANAADGADLPTILRVFREVDRGLRAHIDGEEHYLFGDFEKHHPNEIRELRQEHDRFRRSLDELMIRTELHTVRKEDFERLVSELRAHADKENKTLYRWADETSHRGRRDALFAFLEERRMELRRKGQ